MNSNDPIRLKYVNLAAQRQDRIFELEVMVEQYQQAEALRQAQAQNEDDGQAEGDDGPRRASGIAG